MARSFSITKFIPKDHRGIDQYFIAVTHAADLVHTGKCGDTLDYVSTQGLKLGFSEQSAPPDAPDQVSIFALGITGETFEGKGSFALTVVFQVPNEPDHPEAVEILRLGATGSGPDEKALIARFIGSSSLT
ncbi:MAG TPA: hypothetical protein PKD45_06175 [Flavobacteriales bacterium]|nr:hypothetical protein [Flavobacteriales bacterium]